MIIFVTDIRPEMIMMRTTRGHVAIIQPASSSLITRSQNIWSVSIWHSTYEVAQMYSNKRHIIPAAIEAAAWMRDTL